MKNDKKIDEIILLNKMKWDNWAEEDILEGRKVKFFGISFSFNFHKYQALVVDLINFNSTCKFLDLGCGSGWAVNYAFEKANGKGEFYGLDISQKMINKALEIYKNNNQLHFQMGDSASLPFSDNFFDFIITTNSFHHYPEPDKALSEIKRVLKPGGFVYILDPTSDGPITKIVNILGKIVEKEHVNMYSTRQYRRMFSKAGLEYNRRYKIGLLNSTKVHEGRKI